MRILALLAFVLLMQWAPIACAQKARNLAYEDQFVWYVSARLAGDLVTFQKNAGIKLDENGWAESRSQYEILYHHYLVECNGPLTKIAEILSYFDASTDSDGAGFRALAYVGGMDDKIWPVVREWNSRILVQLLKTYASSKYGFFPECVVQGFKEQNPIPVANKK